MGTRLAAQFCRLRKDDSQQERQDRARRLLRQIAGLRELGRPSDVSRLCLRPDGMRVHGGTYSHRRCVAEGISPMRASRVRPKSLLEHAWANFRIYAATHAE